MTLRYVERDRFPPMSREANDECLAFSIRLRKALAAAGYANAGVVEITRQFNVRHEGGGVSQHAVRKWLTGEAMPTQDKVRVVASMLSVSSVWLRYGEEGHGRTNCEHCPAHASLAPADSRLLTELHGLEPDKQQIARDFIQMLARRHTRRAPN